MDDELEGEGILQLILEHVGAYRRAGPDRTDGEDELLRSVISAIADHPGDVNKQAAAALAVVATYGTVIDLNEFEQILAQFRQIEGLQSIEDVYYVGQGPWGDSELSLRSQLAEAQDDRLNSEERVAIDTFILAAFGVGVGSPSGDVDGGPRS